MAKNLTYTLVQDDEGANLTVHHRGETHLAHSTHPAWDKLLALTMADDPSVVDMFDIARAVGKHLTLSDRVSYAQGHLFLDGDPISDGLTDHIVRMVQAGEDVEPFVALLENILTNPSQNSRVMLYAFIDRFKITITRDGQLVLYKAVEKVDGHYQSTREGSAIVNGDPHTEGKVPQNIGDVVSMPRSQVVDDPGTTCSHGLHVGDWAYFSGGFGQNCVKLEVHVHPRDVVNVPHSDSKLRVCRYTIIREVEKSYDEPVLPLEATETIPEATPQVNVKHPNKKAFLTMRGRAKARKKGFVRYATTVGGWTLIEGDGSDRSHWSV